MQVTAFTKQSNPYIVGIAGGSGSGKTYFAEMLSQRLGHDQCTIVYQDNFYIDQSHRFDQDGGSVNFDHPYSLDFELLAIKLRELKLGLSVEIPIYDFVTHKRLPTTKKIQPLNVIIVDGILIFHPEFLRPLFDLMIFFDTSEELRFKRRLDRDVKERGRTAEGVHRQFFNQVKPMHDQFVEPSKIHAHNVVKEGENLEAVLNNFLSQLKIV